MNIKHIRVYNRVMDTIDPGQKLVRYVLYREIMIKTSMPLRIWSMFGKEM